LEFGGTIRDKKRYDSNMVVSVKGYPKGGNMKQVAYSLSIIVLFLGLIASPVAAEKPASVSALIPTFSILSVDADNNVTIKTYNFPANDTFEVRMGVMGSKGIDGTLITTVNSGSGGSFTATYSIPSGLKGLYQIAIRLQSPTSGYYAYNWFYNNTSSSSSSSSTGTIPTFSITSVDVDNTVTIKTSNFPANDTFDVRMGAIGTRGVNGILVKSISSGTGGTFSATFDIPAALKGSYQIAIRLESPTSGYFAYNWFYNKTSSGTVTPGTIPTFSISSVVVDKTVTIQTKNFPANDTFNVRMGAMGTKGINGILIKSIDSGSGGSFSLTFDIPDSLKGSYQIAIRLESPSSGYFAYNWFYNKTANGTTTIPAGTIPTFTISAVVKDNTVTIKTKNFPANDTFKVLMGKMGTKAVGGYEVATINSGAGGTFTATYNIPSELHGDKQIAIRLQSSASGYYAYNWFYNNTYP
jgi:hypothetical protein